MIPAAQISSTAPSSAFADYLLAQLRCAALRSRLLTAEIDSIGVALRGGFIAPDDAVAWLHQYRRARGLSAT